jgi:hypothetical protein
MNESFAFRTTVPLRRRIDPGRVKVAVVTAIVVVGIGLFVTWVVTSERESFARRHPRVAPSERTVTGVGDAVVLSSTDADAMEATGIALAAAREAYIKRRSFLDAGPAQLSALQPDYTFVDGPSTTSSIVSVASTPHTWAAAVKGSGDTCFWIRSTSAGDVTRGTGPECTGAAAAAIRPPAPR